MTDIGPREYFSVSSHNDSRTWYRKFGEGSIYKFYAEPIHWGVGERTVWWVMVFDVATDEMVHEFNNPKVYRERVRNDKERLGTTSRNG